MTREVKYRELETKAVREKMKPRGKQYWCQVERGAHLGYGG